MVDVVPADADRTARWLSDFEGRMTAWFSPSASTPYLADASPRGTGPTSACSPCSSTTGPRRGHVAAIRRQTDVSASFFPDAAAILAVWVDPEFRRCGLGRAAGAYIEQWARELGTPVLAVRVWQDDRGVAALFNQYPLRSQQMVKPIDTVPLARTGSWKYRPMRPGQEYEEWVTRQITGYADDITGSGSLPAERAREAAVRSYDELLPRGLDTPGHSICVIEDHSAPVADIWLRHGHAAGLAYVFDIEVRPEHRGHGYGRAAVLVGEDVPARAAIPFSA